MHPTNPHLDYFEAIATGRVKYRKARSYYWNDISTYCGYFIHKGASVLEVGCGTGELLGSVKAKRKVGIDFSPAMIAEAQKQFPSLEFHMMNAEDIRLNEKFDVIILSNLVGLLNDVQAVFHCLNRVCHPGTRIIITYYHYLWEPFIRLAEFTSIKKYTPPQNWLTTDDIKNLLHLAGFEVYRSTRRMLCPVYIPFVAWFTNKFLAHLPVLNWFTLNTFCFARPVPHLAPPAPQMGGEVTPSPFGGRGAGWGATVSVIIPTRNEAGNIEEALKRIPEMGNAMEVIFVEGHSIDNTWEKIQEVIPQFSVRFQAGIRSMIQDGKGKADAVRKGFDNAKGDVLMILDADLTVPPEDLPKFYEALVTGKGEFINGSRLVYPVGKEAMRFLNLLGNRFFSIIFSWLLDQHVKDTLCGTKVLFRKDYLKIKENRSFFGDFDPFGDYDLLFGAHKLNLKIVEMPVRYRHRKYGSTNISRFYHGILLLKMCFFAARKIKFF